MITSGARDRWHAPLKEVSVISRSTTLLARACLIGLLAAVLTGCFLRNMVGHVIIVENIPDEVNEVLNAVFGNSTVSVCYRPQQFAVFNCTYIVDGEVISSTLDLVSEFGLAGVLLDPVIVQVPDDAISVTATYSNSGSLLPAVTSIRQSFEYRPFQAITAETGTMFVIMDFPPEVSASINTTDPINGPRFDFALNFAQRKPISEIVNPTNIKVMLTARVESRGFVYYAPILPCVTSFSQVPTITIPITDTFMPMEVQFGDIVRNNQAIRCNNKYYDYSNTPLHRIRLPMVVR